MHPIKLELIILPSGLLMEQKEKNDPTKITHLYNDGFYFCDDAKYIYCPTLDKCIDINDIKVDGENKLINPLLLLIDCHNIYNHDSWMTDDDYFLEYNMGNIWEDVKDLRPKNIQNQFSDGGEIYIDIIGLFQVSTYFDWNSQIEEIDSIDYQGIGQILLSQNPDVQELDEPPNMV